MPNGYTHRRAHRKSMPLAVIAAVGFALAGEVVMSAFIIVGYLIGGPINNDLDLPIKTRKRNAVLIMFYPWFWLYSLFARKVLGGHRSFFTHFPGVATAIRLSWLILPVMLFLWMAGNDPQMILVEPYIKDALIGILVGMSLSDLIHTLLDMFVRS